MPRRAPSQVTVYETVIELENITTTQNVSFLVNNTVRYNATYNISYDVSRNVSYDVVYNQTYNITYNTTVNVTEFVNTTMNVTTSYNITSQPVWKSKFYGKALLRFGQFGAALAAYGAA